MPVNFRMPSKLLYSVLLVIPMLGTLSSNIMSAPLHVIQMELDTNSSGIVLAVSAFTIAMVMFVPLAGWFCDRFGARNVLAYSLGIMIVAEICAAMSQNLTTLIVMRAVQGIGCSAVPPGVLLPLTRLWPEKQAASTAAWAAAIGLGQAVGPPLGGFITEFAGWRFVFIVHASLCLLTITILLKTMPSGDYGRPPLHVSGMACLILGIGAFVVSVTLTGQRAGGPALPLALLVALLALSIYTYIAVRRPHELVAPRTLLEPSFLRSTTAAATSMLVLGVSIVAMPLYLADQLHLQPGQVGLILLGLAAAMTMAAPLSPLLAKVISERRVMQVGLLLIFASTSTLALLVMIDSNASVWALVVALIFTGIGIGCTQSSSALGIARSIVAQRGLALGIHNMIRFGGMATGYAWVAVTYGQNGLWLTFGGAGLIALIALVPTFISPQKIEPTREKHLAVQVHADHEYGQKE